MTNTEVVQSPYAAFADRDRTGILATWMFRTYRTAALIRLIWFR